MNDFMPFVGAVTALVAVLTMIWIGARVFAMSGLGQKHRSVSRNLKIVEILSLDAGRRLVVVSCGKRQVILMIGGKQDLVVGWIDLDESGQ